MARSREWFKRNQGIPFDDVVADLGFTMAPQPGTRLKRIVFSDEAKADIRSIPQPVAITGPRVAICGASRVCFILTSGPHIGLGDI
ncbi:MAG TPA: hypothetical protein VN841_30385 [Bryobacteraceae bacterium]|nr:hypothetical protein [Bryobacteraceae bacterium]